MFLGIKFAICFGKRCHILGYAHLPFVVSFLTSQRLGKLLRLLLLWVTRWLGPGEWGGFGTLWGTHLVGEEKLRPYLPHNGFFHLVSDRKIPAS